MRGEDGLEGRTLVDRLLGFGLAICIKRWLFVDVSKLPYCVVWIGRGKVQLCCHGIFLRPRRSYVFVHVVHDVDDMGRHQIVVKSTEMFDGRCSVVVVWHDVFVSPVLIK